MQAIAESIRQQLGTDTVVLITPGEFTCAVVVAPRPNQAASQPAELQPEPMPGLGLRPRMPTGWRTQSRRPPRRSGCLATLSTAKSERVGWSL